jgi:hypothetical protein
MYRVESIGRVFTNKTREQLQERLTTEGAQGWYFPLSILSVETSRAGLHK